jgi:3-methyladenine DNA glycosylase AlkD
MVHKITQQLWNLSEASYREFTQRLIPDGKPLMGVRMPALRTLAKDLARNGSWDSDSLGYPEDDRYHEETLVRLLSLAYARMDETTRIGKLEILLPHIDNWAVCDSLCSSLKGVLKETDGYRIFIEHHLHDSHPYATRFSIVMLLMHFNDEVWMNRNLSLLGQVKSDHYHVKMAVAWAVASAFSVSPDAVSQWMALKQLDRETARMATQKIRDSKQVPQEKKREISELIRSIYMKEVLETNPRPLSD